MEEIPVAAATGRHKIRHSSKPMTVISPRRTVSPSFRQKILLTVYHNPKKKATKEKDRL
jgi:hypothetical protein